VVACFFWMEQGDWSKNSGKESGLRPTEAGVENGVGEDSRTNGNHLVSMNVVGHPGSNRQLVLQQQHETQQSTNLLEQLLKEASRGQDSEHVGHSGAIANANYARLVEAGALGQLSSVVTLLEEGLDKRDMDAPRIGNTFLPSADTVLMSHHQHSLLSTPKSAKKHQRSPSPDLIGPNKRRRGKSSSLRGVSWHERDCGWTARDWCEKRSVHIGLFRDEEVAGLAVDLHHRFLESNIADGVRLRLNFQSPQKQRQIILRALQENSRDIPLMINSLRAKTIAAPVKNFLLQISFAFSERNPMLIRETDWAMLEK